MSVKEIVLNSNVAIYGAGYAGKLVLQALEKMSIVPVCFIDKNINIQTLNNIEVVDINHVSEKNIDVVIIGIFSYPKDCDTSYLVGQIKSLGIKHIITFEEFYQSLPDIFVNSFYWIAPIEYFKSKKKRIENASKLFSDEKSKNIFDRQIEHRLGKPYDILPKPDFCDTPPHYSICLKILKF